MSKELCRLCLSPDNLAPIFRQEEQWNSYSDILMLTTGVSIQLDDGLPQKICTSCTDAVNQALQLRNQAQSTQQELEKGADCQELDEVDHIEEPDATNSCHDSIPDLEVKVECSRITDQNEDVPKDVPKKQSRKEKREMYLSMVEGGSVEPNCPVKCNVCKKVLSNWATFLGHAQLHIGLKYICEYCGKAFISSTQLRRHAAALHGRRRPLRCARCDYAALDNAQLTLHVRRAHTSERPFACAACGAAYHSRRCLLQHLEGHRAAATVQCDKCERSFRSRRHLARHNYAAHTSKLFVYRCPLCERVYRNVKYVRVHIRRVHGAASDVRAVKIKV